MASHRKRRKHSHRSRSHRRESSVSRRMEKQKKTDFGFFTLLCLIILLGAGIYLFYGKKNSLSDPDFLDQTGTALTLEERLNKKKEGIKLQQAIQSQEAVSEKFKEPVQQIDQLKPEVSSLDMGVRFSDNNSIKSVFEELDEKPFENDIYVDPENKIRRQIAHRDWLEEHLKKRNEAERKEFIRNFIQRAHEQGYKVHFTKGMQVILEPIEPEEEKEDDLEKIKINWK